MRNDQERREFIDNPENWVPAFGSGSVTNVRTMSLKYQGEEWQRVEVYREYEQFDYEQRKHVQKVGWVVAETFAVSPSGLIRRPVTKTQILNRIKEIDKEERAKK